MTSTKRRMRRTGGEGRCRLRLGLCTGLRGVLGGRRGCKGGCLGLGTRLGFRGKCGRKARELSLVGSIRRPGTSSLDLGFLGRKCLQFV